MISVIITAYKEPETIGRALKYLCAPGYSGFEGKLEVIQVSPDKATLEAGKNYISELSNENISFVQIQDPKHGKPHAVNLALEKAKGDVLVLTDGDVVLEKGALGKLINRFLEAELVGACGRVKSLNKRDNFFGYISHLMTGAAHHKRQIELGAETAGFGTQLVKKTSKFFPLSGYLLIFDRKKLEIALEKQFSVPEDCLVEDAYISYQIYNQNLELGYIPESVVFAKFPTTYSDYLLQKKRSTGGFLQLWKYGIVKVETNSRSIFQELRYFWFPFKFAGNIREFFYSLLFFPLRLWLWILMWWERKVIKKGFEQTWQRIETTK